MSQFSVIFNPATDNQEEVIKSVQSLFAIYSALGLQPAATVNDAAVWPCTSIRGGS
mgnify:CR=1 FL=1